MNTEEKEQIIQTDEDGIRFITEPVNGSVYVTITEYIRRKHELDLTKDPLADKLYDSSIRKVMKRGEIIVLKQGIHTFIDWEKYKNYVFMRYRQMPKPKGAKK